MLPTFIRRAHSALNAAFVRRLTPAAESAGQARQELRWMVEELERRRRLPQPAAGSSSSPTRATSDTTAAELEALVSRREAGEPLQYVLGNQPFGPLLLNVRPPTLIPRPETEEWACRLADLLAVDPPATILDLCTGSGCIPLLLLHALPATRAHGVDLSPAALALARENAALQRLGTRFETAERDLFAHGFAARWAEAHGPADLVTSNPPYIPAREMRTLDRAVLDWEDERALLGDVSPSARSLGSLYPASLAHLSRDRGLDFYALIASFLPVLLAPRLTTRPAGAASVPRLVLEVGHDQAGAVKELLHAGPSATVLDRVDIWPDAMGKERVVVGF